MSDSDPRAPVSRTDHSLIRRFRGGEQDAATQLYLRYANRLQALARAQTSEALSPRFDAEDVVQSVFRTFFRRAAEGLYDVPPGEELWQLLLVLSLNKIRELAAHHRAQKRDVSRTQGSDQLDTPAAAHDTQDENSLHILKMVIDELIGDLPEANREIVHLRIEGHKVHEIADQTQRSQRTVERVLREFRLRLGRLIDEQAHHE